MSSAKYVSCVNYEKAAQVSQLGSWAVMVSKSDSPKNSVNCEIGGQYFLNSGSCGNCGNCASYGSCAAQANDRRSYRLTSTNI
jgi:NADH:ubiquinone oxidoreductase subunit F (NADH-binding)